MSFLPNCCMFLMFFSFHAGFLVSSNLTTASTGEIYIEDGFIEDVNSSESGDTLENVDDLTNISVVLKMSTPCETPNHDPGYCIGIKSCPILSKQLANLKARSFLRESMCGPDNENRQNPRVCCGKFDNYRNVSNIVDDNKIFPKKCGYQKMFMRGRIIGGTKASLGEFPWMARLLHKNRYGYKTFGCSAFLIHTKYVVTAAHCVHSNFTRIRGPVFSVVLGEHNSETKIDCSPGENKCADPLQISRVAKVIVHPEYDILSDGHFNDIALIYLNKGARMTEYVQPICLLMDATLIPNKYALSGWGKTETDQVSTIKMKVDLSSFDKTKCYEKFRLLNIELRDTQICAGGENGKDSCNGDSGGPLMMTTNGTTWFAAGVVSYGVGCGYDGWPGVYTNIPSFVPWIELQIIKNGLVRNRTHADKSTKKTHKKHKNASKSQVTN